VITMVIILLIVPMNVGNKMITRRRRAIRKTCTTRRHALQDDESSYCESDDVTTVAIKGSSSSRKSLFTNPNKGKYTCLMAKENKKKVKSKSSPSKYVFSDDKLDSSGEEDEETLLNDMFKNHKERMKGLLKEIKI
jgi:hypothetical protein